MRNLLSAVLAVTMLGALGCESCWEAREPPSQASSAPAAPAAEPTPPPAAQPAPPPTAPPPAVAATNLAPSPRELAHERDLQERRDSGPLRRLEPGQIRLGGQRVMAKPSIKFRPARERPIPTLSTGGNRTTPAPAPAPPPQQ